jgi:hypothetical protein
MKTVELCLEDWQERMNKTGKRQVEVDSAANLTLKVWFNRYHWCFDGVIDQICILRYSSLYT